MYVFTEKILEKIIARVVKYAPFKNPRKIPPGIFHNQGGVSPPDKNLIAGTVYHYLEQKIVYLFGIVLAIYGKTSKGKY
jgi:hypothetical protein